MAAGKHGFFFPARTCDGRSIVLYYSDETLHEKSSSLYYKIRRRCRSRLRGTLSIATFSKAVVITKYDTLIFDLDGTLLDTLDDLTDSLNFSMRECGYPQRTKDEVRCFVGNGIGRLVALSVPEGTSRDGLNKALLAFQSHYVLNCAHKTKPYNGIQAMLETARSKGFRMAIVSNKIDTAVKALSKRYFGEWIDVAIGERQNVRRKPYPDTVVTAIQELKADAEHAVYVGDSEVDIATAQNAGLPCISVSWGFRSPEELVRSGADVIVNTPEELIRFLDVLE